MNDRELLEMAAKACDRKTTLLPPSPEPIRDWMYEDDDWNPLTDDGDALRLAMKLKLKIEPSISRNGVYVGPWGTAPWAEDAHESQDIFGATRRAIVRAAAEIGRDMP